MAVSIDELASCLSLTLSPDTNTRIAAELKLSELSANPETGLTLAQLIATQDAELGLRQHSACVALRKFVNERWSPALPRWRHTHTPVEIKAQIRQSVFQNLSDPQNKIRSLCAQIITTIANSDWPDEWPDLLDSLIALLSSNSPPAVHGAMQVLSEFIKSDLTEDQILPVLRQLLPILLNILGAPEQHSILTRARSVAVFRTCVETLFMVKSEHPQAVKEASASILPAWLDAFMYLLNVDPRQDVENTPNWDGVALRIQIYRALDTIHVPFWRQLEPYANAFLSASLNHLTILYPTYVCYYLQGDESVPTPSENESTELSQLFCSIVDLVSAMTRAGRGKSWFNQENVNSLVLATINWIQITKDDEEEWVNNANAFVQHEAEDTLGVSVRVAGHDMLGSLIERYTPLTMASLQRSIQEITTQSNEQHNAGNADWWRLLESMLATLGSQSEDILEWIEDETAEGHSNPIHIDTLLSNVVPNLLSLSECPFLQGRGFVFASQFTKILPTQLAGQYLQATVEVLESSEAGVPIKVSAIRAVHNFCQGIDDSLLVPVVPRITKSIGPFLSITTEDTLTLVLEALDVIVEIDGGSWMTGDLASALVSAVLEIWVKNNKDPIFISLLTEILASVAASPTHGVYQTVVNQALPPLATAIMTSTAKESWVTGAAIDLVGSIVRGAPDSGLGGGFVGHLAPSLFLALRTDEDRDVIQNGISCVTLIIRKDFPQLQDWVDPTSGQTGLQCVLEIIAKQLKSQDESGGLVVGDLIIHLLRKAGDAVGPVLPELLQAMVSRMTNVKTATFIQSLVIPFAFLIYNRRDTTLSLLESIIVDGRSGLDILIQTWCENEETFQGFWAQRISTLALCSLFASSRLSLQQIAVKGDLIIKPETKNGRSASLSKKGTKKVPTEFTSVPFPVKALKLVLNDLQSGGEAASKNIEATDVDSDDGDDDWVEESNAGLKEDEMAFLSDLIKGPVPSGLPFDMDDPLEVPDDEDLRSDPVNQIDMRSHIVSFLKESAANNTNNFSTVVDQLTTDEILVVRQALGQ